MTAGIKPTGSLSLRSDMTADANPTHSFLLSQNIAANYKSDTGAHRAQFYADMATKLYILDVRPFNADGCSPPTDSSKSRSQ